ncbi:MAG: sigma-70 family RNA polymerase sigma factor [Anaerolineae bacterium]|nr:sigma-70 family RNA polymerase sigma factor [Anaerolineae bacterium]
MTTVSDQEWVRLLRQGDEDATNDLWFMLYKDAIHLARRYRQSDDCGYDAAVQAFQNLQRRGIYQFNFTSSFRTYCWTILSREVIRQFGDEIDTVELTFDPPDHSSPLHQIDATQIWARLQPCVKRLSPQRRRVFELVDLQGMRPAAAAQELDLTRNNVNQLAARARQDLRKCLQGYGFKTSEDVLGL